MSWPLGISGPMVSVLPESQGLEDDDDDDSDKFRYSCHSAHSSPPSKSNDSLDDSQTEDLRESIPFSLTPRHSNMVEGEQVELEEEDQEFQEPFYKDHFKKSDNLSGDKEPSPTQHFPGHQGSPGLQRASMAPCGSQDSFQSNTDQHLEMEAAAPQAHASDPYVGPSQCTTGAEPRMLHKEAIWDRDFPSLQLTYSILREENSMIREENKVLKDKNLALEEENYVLREIFYGLREDNVVLMEENVVLSGEYNMFREQYDRLKDENDTLREDNATIRRMFKNFQNSLETQACMVSSLQEQLKTSLAERKREARELESVVQQTKCNLQLMTQRALDAEGNMERLKQKIFILQGQLERSKLENENLRADLPGSSEARLRLHVAKPPQAHNGRKWLHQAAPASGMKVLPVIAEVLESTSKILKL
ncbi:PREDICTED: serologically defined colon cancer antigen 3 isoform X1 [Lepidothrix coronata]|uniref:Endosome-associated-trafficking regulator 1 n=1 Tax=Lepidothrix coronata TaxID=321398 RepID=A0A6J0HWB2_9PASS|nr:PREDICTED: serologically defined colon cancer antigen 3 isoform X1 [Lepidothrix coronata]